VAQDQLASTIAHTASMPRCLAIVSQHPKRHHDLWPWSLVVERSSIPWEPAAHQDCAPRRLTPATELPQNIQPAPNSAAQQKHYQHRGLCSQAQLLQNVPTHIMCMMQTRVGAKVNKVSIVEMRVECVTDCVHLIDHSIPPAICDNPRRCKIGLAPSCAK
jgi:hypothetical protein